MTNNLERSSAIFVEGLNKSFRTGFFGFKKQVLHDISFNVPSGKTTGFVGNNGSGKTTSLKCILQFIQPDQGKIQFWGQPVSDELKLKLGYLPERPYLYEFCTGMEYLKIHWHLGAVKGMTKSGQFSEKAEEVLKKVNLFDARHKTLRNYSKGMLQRVGIAQALLHDPKLLILDEPMSGLDPDGRFLVKEIIREEKKRGTTIFFSSHLLQDMDELCEHLVVVHHGKILYNGDLEKFTEKYKNLEVAFQAFKEAQK
jgi:ABC-2 type transport system ATP-binding protein